MSKYLIAIGAAFAVMAGWSAMMHNKGVIAERVRVESQGKKTHVKAKAARAAVEKKQAPEVRADLSRYCVDCSK